MYVTRQYEVILCDSCGVEIPRCYQEANFITISLHGNPWEERCSKRVHMCENCLSKMLAKFKIDKEDLKKYHESW